MEGGGLRERLSSLERREKVGVAMIGALVAAGAVVWYMRSLPSTVHVEDLRGGGGGAVGGSARSGGGGPAPGPSATPAQIVVDVAGRVRHPGVYTFHLGDRVVDAIQRAGGALPGSDLTSLNLAALLTDAEQIVVGKAGGGVSSGTSSGGGGGGPGAPGAKVNINTATADQLDGLPGIGPVLAQRIIDYRTQHGPFRSVRDLLNVPGIGDSHMADLEPLVTV